jgi:replicative DNA helicase Mcm
MKWLLNGMTTEDGGGNSVGPELAEDLLSVVENLENRYDEGAPVNKVTERAKSRYGGSSQQVEEALDSLRQQGEVYEPRNNHLRST